MHRAKNFVSWDQLSALICMDEPFSYEGMLISV